MNKQTAVEWITEQMDFYFSQAQKEQTTHLFQLAKAMEKEQTMAFAKLWEEKLLDGKIDSVDDLYNESYGK